MSADLIDDLHAAEDLLGSVVALTAALDGDGDLITIAQSLVAMYEGYCRPSCEADGDLDACQDDDPDLCGCPCHNREVD